MSTELLFCDVQRAREFSHQVTSFMLNSLKVACCSSYIFTGLQSLSNIIQHFFFHFISPASMQCHFQSFPPHNLNGSEAQFAAVETCQCSNRITFFSPTHVHHLLHPAGLCRPQEFLNIELGIFMDLTCSQGHRYAGRKERDVYKLFSQIWECAIVKKCLFAVALILHITKW